MKRIPETDTDCNTRRNGSSSKTRSEPPKLEDCRPVETWRDLRRFRKQCRAKLTELYHLKVVWCLADHWTDDGGCFPGKKTIYEDSGIPGRGYVQKAIDELTALHMIVPVKGGHVGNGGPGYSYTLLLHPEGVLSGQDTLQAQSDEAEPKGILPQQDTSMSEGILPRRTKVSCHGGKGILPRQDRCKDEKDSDDIYTEPRLLIRKRGKPTNLRVIDGSPPRPGHSRSSGDKKSYRLDESDIVFIRENCPHVYENLDPHVAKWRVHPSQPKDGDCRNHLRQFLLQAEIWEAKDAAKPEVVRRRRGDELSGAELLLAEGMAMDAAMDGAIDVDVEEVG